MSSNSIFNSLIAPTNVLLLVLRSENALTFNLSIVKQSSPLLPPMPFISSLNASILSSKSFSKSIISSFILFISSDKAWSPIGLSFRSFFNSLIAPSNVLSSVISSGNSLSIRPSIVKSSSSRIIISSLSSCSKFPISSLILFTSSSINSNTSLLVDLAFNSFIAPSIVLSLVVNSGNVPSIKPSIVRSSSSRIIISSLSFSISCSINSNTSE